MPRFFFHTADGSRQRDTVGTELKDVATARREGVRIGASILAEDPDLLWDGREFRVLVTDQSDQLLVTVIMMAVDVGQVEGLRERG